MLDYDDELKPCPCSPATTCMMDELCYGCEEYARWLSKLDDWRVNELEEEDD